MTEYRVSDVPVPIKPVEPIDLMLDLETLGLSPGCAILEIALVRFDAEPELVFRRQVSVASCVRAGLRMEPETVEWWMKQSDAARLRWSADSAILLGEALGSLRSCVGRLRFNAARGDSPLRLWANGAAFDVPILEAAYRACDLPIPWNYREVRDMRTLMDLAEVDKDAIPFEGIEHSAADDAMHQARLCRLALQRLEDRIER